MSESRRHCLLDRQVPKEALRMSLSLGPRSQRPYRLPDPHGRSGSKHLRAGQRGDRDPLQRRDDPSRARRRERYPNRPSDQALAEEYCFRPRPLAQFRAPFVRETDESGCGRVFRRWFSYGTSACLRWPREHLDIPNQSVLIAEVGLGRRFNRSEDVRRALVQLDGSLGCTDLIAGHRGHCLAQFDQLVISADLVGRCFPPQCDSQGTVFDRSHLVFLLQRVDRVDDLFVRRLGDGFPLDLVYPFPTLFGQATRLEHFANSCQPQALDRSQLDKPCQVVNVDCRNRPWLAIGGGAVSVRLDFFGEGALFSWCVVERWRDDNGMLTLPLVTLPRDRRHAKGLCLELGPFLLLALGFKCRRVPPRRVVDIGAKMCLSYTVRLTFSADPRRVESKTAESLNNLDLQPVLIVPGVPKSVGDGERGPPSRLLGDESQ